MLTVKRKVDTEEDRYGGFDVTTDTPVGYDIEINQSYSTAQTVKGETLNYSPREAIEANTESSPIKKRLRSEELMPSVKTKPEEDTQQLSIRQKMETRTKAMLAVYLLVVVALAAIVIATGVAINAANARVVSLNRDIEARNSTIIEQTTDLELLNNETFIKGSAYDNGLVEAHEPIQIELLPVGESTNYQRSTNWFDKFCDFMSRIFGG